MWPRFFWLNLYFKHVYLKEKATRNKCRCASCFCRSWSFRFCGLGGNNVTFTAKWCRGQGVKPKESKCLKTIREQLEAPPVAHSQTGQGTKFALEEGWLEEQISALNSPMKPAYVTGFSSQCDRGRRFNFHRVLTIGPNQNIQLFLPSLRNTLYNRGRTTCLNERKGDSVHHETLHFPFLTLIWTLNYWYLYYIGDILQIISHFQLFAQVKLYFSSKKEILLVIVWILYVFVDNKGGDFSYLK